MSHHSQVGVWLIFRPETAWLRLKRASRKMCLTPSAPDKVQHPCEALPRKRDRRPFGMRNPTRTPVPCQLARLSPFSPFFDRCVPESHQRVQ